MIIGGLSNTEIRMFNIKTGACTLKMKSPNKAPVKAILVDREGDLITASATRVYMWNMEMGRLRQTLRGHTSSVLALCARPDGTVVSGSFDATIRVWDVERGVCLSVLCGHQSAVNALCVMNKEDSLICSGSNDCSIKSALIIFLLFNSYIVIFKNLVS